MGRGSNHGLADELNEIRHDFGGVREHQRSRAKRNLALLRSANGFLRS